MKPIRLETTLSKKFQHAKHVYKKIEYLIVCCETYTKNFSISKFVHQTEPVKFTNEEMLLMRNTFNTIVVTYCSCFNSKGRYYKLKETDIKYRKEFVDLHKHLFEARNKYVAHSDESFFNQDDLYLNCDSEQNDFFISTKSGDGEIIGGEVFEYDSLYPLLFCYKEIVRDDLNNMMKKMELEIEIYQRAGIDFLTQKGQQDEPITQKDIERLSSLPALNI